MINVIGSGNLSIKFYEDSKLIEIKDTNGLGMMLDIDQFKEFKEMIDFMHGANNLWRYTSENGPHTLRG